MTFHTFSFVFENNSVTKTGPRHRLLVYKKCSRCIIRLLFFKLLPHLAGRSLVSLGAGTLLNFKSPFITGGVRNSDVHPDVWDTIKKKTKQWTHNLIQKLFAVGWLDLVEPEKTFSFTCSHPYCLHRWLWSWRQKYQPRPSGGAHECMAAHRLDAMPTVSQREMLGLIKRCRSTHLFWRCITSPPLWKRQWRCEGHVAEA